MAKKATKRGKSGGKSGAGYKAVIDDLVTGNRILYDQGVVDGYGHVSVRSPGNPNHYFLARAGAPGLVTAADIIEYDLDSVPVSNNPGAEYTERFIHGEIYKARPEVMALVHCHCSEVIPFADTGVPLRPMHHMGFFIGQGVPVFDIRKAAGETDILIRTAALGKALAGGQPGERGRLLGDDRHVREQRLERRQDDRLGRLVGGGDRALVGLHPRRPVAPVVLQDHGAGAPRDGPQ